MSRERLKSLETQKRDAEEILNLLQEKEARFPPNSVPVDVQTSINEQKKKIENIRKEILELSFLVAKEKSTNSIPFINRNEEIKLITSSLAASYYIVDGPEGFGKTELLKQLSLVFKDDKWLCRYISAAEQDSLLIFINSLVDAFNIEEKFLPEQGVPYDVWFAGALRRLWNNTKEGESGLNKEGIAILIDLDKRPSLEILDSLLTKLIPNISKALFDIASFSSKQNLFRVVIAGRHLARLSNDVKHNVSLKILSLSPFSYDVIKSSIRGDYLQDAISRFAADVLFHTGGHPGCISEILNLYEKKSDSMSEFFGKNGNEIWELIILPKIGEIRNNLFNISSILKDLVDDISVFRFLDYKILRMIIQEHNLIGRISEYDLADDLTKSYLLSWKQRLLRDDITRRLFSIRQWKSNPEAFKLSCEKAQNLYRDQLSADVPSPERWAIEALFQGLQKYAGYIHAADQRQKIKTEFLEELIPSVLNALSQNRVFREERIHLMQSMDEDWEFQFTVNYYMHSNNIDISDNLPYQEVKKVISSFVA